jgi:alanyl-tRNA synthetase
VTEKIYFMDPYISKFAARVVSVRKVEGKYHVVLNRTAFYPEGGGQPCDLGEIGDLAVHYVYERGGQVFHVLDGELKVGREVDCAIHWGRRFDHMQQHLGQHLLSGVLAELYGAETVSFHLGMEGVSIDIDLPLDWGELKRVEGRVNEIILANLEVTTFFVSDRELAGLALRKPPVVKGKVRLVSIPAVDLIACGGTHPYTTGEVGHLKILDGRKYKGGTRISFLSGHRALGDYEEKNQQLLTLSGMLSVPPEGVVDAVRHLRSKIVELARENTGLKERFLEWESESLMGSAEARALGKIIRKVFVGREMEEIKVLANKLTLQAHVTVLFGIKGPEKGQLLFARSRDGREVDLASLLQKVLPLVEGKGGGSKYSAQGGGKLAEGVDAAVELAYDELVSG